MERDENDNLANTNPARKPYIAMVDPALCGEEGDKLFWAVNAFGPSTGAGDYITNFIFNMGSMTIHGEMVNTMGNCAPDCELVKSQLSYTGDGGTLRGGITFDYTNPLLSKVKFLEEGISDVYVSGTVSDIPRDSVKGLKSLKRNSILKNHKSAPGWKSMRALRPRDGYHNSMPKAATSHRDKKKVSVPLARCSTLAYAISFKMCF